MAKRKKINVSDVFSVKVSESEFIYGRVLFDVTKQYMKKSYNPEGNNYSYLSFFNKCFLIETFLGVSSSF